MSLSGAQEPGRPFRVTWAEVPGGVIPVWTAGAGKPVLLVHGLSANHSEWTEVAVRLAPAFHVILPDLVGRGASLPEARADFSLEVEVERLLHVLRAVGVTDGPEPPLVAGHSHGAALAVALACRTPVAGLVLANPVTPWTRRPPVLDLLHRPAIRRTIEPLLRACRRPLTRYILTRRVYGSPPASIERAVARYAEPYADPNRGRALLRVLRDWQPAALEGLRPDGVPMEVLAGGEDRRIGAEEAARWAARLGAGFDVVDDAAHAVPEEAPDRVAALIRRVAAGLAGREEREDTERTPAREPENQDDE